MVGVLEAAQRLEDEMGDWGSVSMRLGDEYLEDIRALIKFARDSDSRPKDGDAKLGATRD